MTKVRESLDRLKESFISCDAVVRYQKICREIREYPEKEQRLHEFRRKNYILQNTKEPVDLYVEVDRLKQEYADLFRDPMLNEYLAAEVAVCRVIQQINRELIEILDFEAVLVDD